MRSVAYGCAVAAAALAAGCGGGDDAGAPVLVAPPTPAPVGVYDSTYSVPSPAESGSLYVGTDGRAVYVGARANIGHGTWARSGDTHTLTVTTIPRLVDQLGNEFPIARGFTSARNLSVTQGSSGSYSGAGFVMTARTVPSPTLAAAAGTWSFSNIFRFNGTNINYSANVAVSAGGQISGTDSNGCVFSGSLAPAGLLFSARVIATSCGASATYIDNYQFDGFAVITDGPLAGRRMLSIRTANSAVNLGLAFDLISPP